MKLIIGLGNHDEHYSATRHNIGFAVLDTFAHMHGAPWHTKDKFKADIAETVIAGQKVLLAKPRTYYNASGDAVLALQQFYKLSAADILVVHDELALPFGAVRTRIGGRDAGNNGLKSIIAAVGANIARIRIGIANEYTARQDATDFVLNTFTAEETQTMPAIKKHAALYITTFLEDSFGHTTTKIA